VTVQDLSLTGCLLQSPTGLEAGAIVDVRVEMAAQTLFTKARVIDTSVDGAALPAALRYLVGLEFVGLAARATADLRSFLEAESRRRRGPAPGFGVA
jgi:hypothetical protein